jgi:hypothetical protein
LASSAKDAGGMIEACVPSANRYAISPSDPDLALDALERLSSAIALLERVMSAAVALYAEVCARVADRLAVAEERLPATGDSRPRLTAHVLAAAARALVPGRRAVLPSEIARRWV